MSGYIFYGKNWEIKIKIKIKYLEVSHWLILARKQSIWDIINLSHILELKELFHWLFYRSSFEYNFCKYRQVYCVLWYRTNKKNTRFLLAFRYCVFAVRASSYSFFPPVSVGLGCVLRLARLRFRFSHVYVPVFSRFTARVHFLDALCASCVSR